LSGIDICASPVLWLERTLGAATPIDVATRIGLSRDQQRRLRFIERGSPFVSVPP
jgi:DNA-3-methyladenine glycosylase